MEIGKDVYAYLANFADDQTILNMISVNKKFNDPKFFEKIMKRKYPLLIPFKDIKDNKIPDIKSSFEEKKEETWKQFYLKMVYYISKLQEEYNFPYIPNKHFNPETFYKNSQNFGYDNWNKGLKYAAEIGRKDLVDYMIESGAKELDSAIETAALHGQIEMVNYLISEEVKNFHRTMYWAAYGGHIDIIKLMIEKIIEKDDDLKAGLDSSLMSAAYQGHFDIVKFLLKQGATDLDKAMSQAVKKGHIEIVKLLIENGATNFNQGLIDAAKEGYLDIIKLMVEKGATKFKKALKLAKYESEYPSYKDISVIGYLENLLKF